jgi:hypothetical protein
MLVALGIGAAVMSAGIMAYSSIVVGGPSRTKSFDVPISSATFQILYGQSSSNVAVSQAPDYAAAAMAESMRVALERDVSSSVAVFCLAREGLSSVAMRPTSLTVATNFDARTLSSPEDFRAFLDPAASVFTAFSGAMTTENSSTYILGRSTTASEVRVRAIYETDMIPTADPAGIYASVRRYEGTSLTGYYHVFYPDRPGVAQSFQPHAVFFSKEALATGVAAADTFRRAANRPFYFLWWPDPSVSTLETLTSPESGLSTTEPRAEYYNMKEKTSLFFVLPAFPPL